MHLNTLMAVPSPPVHPGLEVPHVLLLLQLCISKLTNLKVNLNLLNFKSLAVLRSADGCLDRNWVSQAKPHSSHGHAGDIGAQAVLTG